MSLELLANLFFFFCVTSFHISIFTAIAATAFSVLMVKNGIENNEKKMHKNYVELTIV